MTVIKRPRVYVHIVLDELGRILGVYSNSKDAINHVNALWYSEQNIDAQIEMHEVK